MVPPLDAGRSGAGTGRAEGRGIRPSRPPCRPLLAIMGGVVVGLIVSRSLESPGDLGGRLMLFLLSGALLTTVVALVFRSKAGVDAERARSTEALRHRLLAETLEEAHRELRRRLEVEQAMLDADRSKDQFLATLCHELRNPLAAIDLAGELLSAPEVDDERRGWAVRTVRNQARQLGRLIEDLLDLSQIAGGSISLDLRSVSLAEAIRSAVDAARPFLEEARQAVRLDLGEATIWVRADPVRIQQVFINLLSNACRYSDPDRTTTIEALPEGESVVVLVRDEGIGIEPALLPKIFEMFVRGPDARDRSPGGLGVGLRLAKLIVERHEGTVEARSAGAGLGSEFEIRLPIAPPPASAGEPGRSDPPRPGRMRLLIVDDNRDLSDALGLLLHRDGHEVRTARSGGEAIASIARERPDLVLLDLELPDRSGIEVALAVRDAESSPGVPIVVLTGSARPVDLDRLRDAGVMGFLQKPIRIEELRETLARTRCEPEGPSRAIGE